MAWNQQQFMNQRQNPAFGMPPQGGGHTVMPSPPWMQGPSTAIPMPSPPWMQGPTGGSTPMPPSSGQFPQQRPPYVPGQGFAGGGMQRPPYVPGQGFAGGGLTPLAVPPQGGGPGGSIPMPPPGAAVSRTFSPIRGPSGIGIQPQGPTQGMTTAPTPQASGLGLPASPTYPTGMPGGSIIGRPGYQGPNFQTQQQPSGLGLPASPTYPTGMPGGSIIGRPGYQGPLPATGQPTGPTQTQPAVPELQPPPQEPVATAKPATRPIAKIRTASRRSGGKRQPWKWQANVNQRRASILNPLGNVGGTPVGYGRRTT